VSRIGTDELRDAVLDEGSFISWDSAPLQVATNESYARELADAAHQVCPYSRATRGNISVELRLSGPAATTEQPA